MRVNDRRLVAAACAASSGAALMYSSVPVFLGAAAERFGLDEQQIGTLASAYTTGYLIASASAYLWIQHGNWRRMVAGSLLFGGLAFGVFTQIGSFVGALLMQVVIGALMGSAYTVLLRVLGDLPEPDRIYGVKNACEIGLSAVIVFGISHWIVPAWGFAGMAIVYALFLCALVPTARWIPVHASAPSHIVPTVQVAGWGAGHVALLSLLVHFGGATTLWTFLERIGANVGLTQKESGAVLSVGLLIGMAGSLLASWIGATCRRWLVAVGANAAIVGAITLVALEPTGGTYKIAVGLFMLAWNLFIPYQIGIIADADPGKKLLALVPAAASVGAIGGPVIGGTLIVQSGYVLTYVSITAAMLIGLALYIAVASTLQTESTALADAGELPQS